MRPSSSTLAISQHGSDYYYLRRQALFALTGTGALILFRHFPYRYFRNLAYPLLATALTVLALVPWTEFGHAAGGSTEAF